MSRLVGGQAGSSDQPRRARQSPNVARPNVGKLDRTCKFGRPIGPSRKKKDAPAQYSNHHHSKMGSSMPLGRVARAWRGPGLGHNQFASMQMPLAASGEFSRRRAPTHKASGVHGNTRALSTGRGSNRNRRSLRLGLYAMSQLEENLGQHGSSPPPTPSSYVQHCNEGTSTTTTLILTTLYHPSRSRTPHHPRQSTASTTWSTLACSTPTPPLPPPTSPSTLPTTHRRST